MEFCLGSFHKLGDIWPPSPPMKNYQTQEFYWKIRIRVLPFTKAPLGSQNLFSSNRDDVIFNFD